MKKGLLALLCLSMVIALPACKKETSTKEKTGKEMKEKKGKKEGKEKGTKEKHHKKHKKEKKGKEMPKEEGMTRRRTAY